MTPILNPRRIATGDLHLARNQSGDQLLLQRPLDSMAMIECIGQFRSGSKHLVCLLPSAQQGSSARANPVFHRWTWANDLQNTHVLCFSDPGLYYSPLHAAWFSSPSPLDVIESMADFIKEIADRLEIPTDHIMLYGSSMGGFGALMLGGHLSGSMVIAEVPQIDLRKYAVASAISSLEHHYFSNQSIADYYEINCHRINVMDRFLLTGQVPCIKIITNAADAAHEEHSIFIQHLNEKRSEFKQFGDLAIVHRSDLIGHKPLSTSTALGYIQAAMLEGWSHSANNSASGAPLAISPVNSRYRTVLDKAIAACSLIKYTRTPEDRTHYELAKALLLEASDLNPDADWPYLKLCSLTKLWTNSFSNDLLNFALAALTRKETLEAFIYACRGAACNNTSLIALEKIKQLQVCCTNVDIANIANIFIGGIQHERGDFAGYERSIELFKATKSPNFSPYIAIPVSTVITDTLLLAPDVEPSSPTLLGKMLRHAEVHHDQVRYVISASCDSGYFEKYGEFFIKSFTQVCSHESAIHLNFTRGKTDAIRAKISEWAGRNVFFSIQDIDTEINEAPMASLLRFVSLPHLIETLKVPVFVLDLDTVIKSSLLPVVQKYEGVDICARILGGGVAPWEKYTGGFALFYPSNASVSVAKSIAKAAEIMASPSEKQWWIDQNCFEAGIRHTMKSGADFKMVDFSAVRDAHCTMPVGNEASKLFQLRKALEAMGIDANVSHVDG